MTTEDAKSYLSKREIPRLFESLMTGLMYHRPTDHIQYLIDCLHKVNEKGQENITWSSFVDIRRNKTPLPPISNGQVRPRSKGEARPSSKTRAKEEKGPGRTSPLPDIPASKVEKVSLPDIPIVLVLGAPGSGKDRQVDELLKRYPGWKHLNMGVLIKSEIQRRGDAHTKWKLTKDLMSRGEAAPEDITIETLISGLKDCRSSKGIILTGFPRTLQQVADYTKAVSRVDVVFLIDLDEKKALDRLLLRGRTSNRPEDSMSAVTTRLNYFKAHTLPTIKYYDDQGKLVIVDGDAGDDMVKYEFGKAFDKVFFSKYGSKALDAKPLQSAGSNIPNAPTYKKAFENDDDEDGKPLFVGEVPEPPTIVEADTGRNPGLPEGPIIFVAGGPGSGKGTQCARIIKRYPDFVHISMGDLIRAEISKKGTADQKWTMISQLVSKGEMAPEQETVGLLKQQLIKHKSAKAFIIDGFPRNKAQVEAFNKEIGGLNFVILFDCEEYYMQNRLLKRGRESGRIDDNATAVANRLNFYKYNTLPVMKYYDDEGKLVVRNIADLDADKDMDEMFYDISQMFDFAFFGRKPGESNPSFMTESPSKPVRTSTDLIKDEEISASRLAAGFRASFIRQKNVLRRTPSYTSKYGKSSDKSSKDSRELKKEHADDKSTVSHAEERILAGFVGMQKRHEHAARKTKGKATNKSSNRSKLSDDSKASLQIKAGFAATQKRDAKKKEKENAKALEKRLVAGFAGASKRSEFRKIEKNKTEEMKKDEKSSAKPRLSEQEEAAIRIQAGFQGYKARKEIAAMREAKDKSSPAS